MHSARTSILTAAMALWSLVTSTTAYTCSATEDSRVYQLYESVASDPVCSPYVTSGTSVKWSCDKTPDCTVLIQQLAEALPDCQSSKDGTNYRSQLNDALYGTCKLCTLDQLRAFSALTKQVSASAACSPYSGGSGGFTWPCSASGCTAVVKSVSKDVPSCNYAGDNLQARVLNDIEACTGTSVSTTRPPSVGGSGDDPSRPSSTSTPSTSTTTPSPVSGSETAEEATSAPSPTSTSTRSPTTTPAPTTPPKACTDTEKNSARLLLGAAANSTSCASADKFVYQTSISITAKCSSSCIETAVRPLAKTLPDCITDGSSFSKSARAEVASEIERCDSDETNSLTAYVSVYFTSSSKSGGSAAGPAKSISKSGATALVPSGWVATAALLAALVALI